MQDKSLIWIFSKDDFRVKDILEVSDYTIVMDVAEKNVKNYAGNDTVLSFKVNINEDSNINAFSENIDLKSSIVRGLWLVDYNKIH